MDGPFLRVHIQCIAGVHYNPLLENRLYSCQNRDRHSNKDDESIEDCLGELEEVDSEIDQDVLVKVFTTCDVQYCCACRSSSTAARTVMQIGSVTCCALIDTGAQISQMSYHIWMQLSKKGREEASPSSDAVRIRGLGSSGTNTSGLANLQWKLAGRQVSSRTPFEWVDQGDMPFCLIIGGNAIKQVNLVLDFDASQFFFDCVEGRALASFASGGQLQDEDHCLV